MSLSGSSDSRWRSWATTRFAIWSSIGVPEEDDPLVQEARVDVEGALAARRLLDHHRDQRAHPRCLHAHGFSSLPGVHIFMPLPPFSFSGVQSFSRAFASSTGIRLTPGDDLVERLPQAQVAAQLLEAAALAHGRDRLVGILAGGGRLARGSAPRPPRRRPRCSRSSATASSTSSRLTARSASALALGLRGPPASGRSPAGRSGR